MAGKGYGVKKTGKLRLQAGAEVSEEQDFSLKGTAAFVGDVSLLPTRPKRGDAHPKDRRLTCYALKTIWGKLDTVRVEADYIGLDQNPTPYFIEFCGSVGEEAIETHPYFTSVIGGTPAAPLNGAVFDEDGSFLGFPAGAGEHLAGVRSYYRPSVIVRLSYWQQEKPNPGPLGHIQDPSYIPDLVLPDGCHNLLVTNFGHRTLCPRTPPYQITVEMLASGPLGWNTTIYSF